MGGRALAARTEQEEEEEEMEEEAEEEAYIPSIKILHMFNSVDIMPK